MHKRSDEAIKSHFYSVSSDDEIYAIIDWANSYGFEIDELAKLISVLLASSQVKVKSVFSHLVASDNTDLDNFTNKQIVEFTNCFNRLEEALGYKVIKHLCNSAAISRFKEAHFDMVRLGIGMYGIGANNEEQKNIQNVSALKTIKSRINQ